MWDKNEDPKERMNLIDVRVYRDTVLAIHDGLWTRLRDTASLRIPLRRGDWQTAERGARSP